LYRLTNAGGDRIKPEGSVVIRSVLGWRVAKVNANPTEGSVLPGTTRKFNTSWEKNTQELQNQNEPYSYFRNVKEQWRNFALGIFRAKVHITYGFENIETVKSKSFYFLVFPLELVIVLVIGGGSIVTGIRFALIRYHRLVMRKAYAAVQEKNKDK
jgi:hypothetical protein